MSFPLAKSISGTITRNRGPARMVNVKVRLVNSRLNEKLRLAQQQDFPVDESRITGRNNKLLFFLSFSTSGITMVLIDSKNYSFQIPAQK